MASKRQTDHRRKRKVRIPKSSPFPVPIATLSCVPSKQNYWFYYTGELKDDHVTVSHSGDISFLYTMGFFGRGLLSRGAADFHRSLPDVYIPTPDGGTDILKVIRRRMYLRHKQWQLRQDQSTELTSISTTIPAELQEFDSDVEYLDTPEQYDMQNEFSQFPQQKHDIPTGKQSADLADPDIDKETAVSDQDEPTAGEGVWKDTAEAGWDSAEVDEDFWRVEDKDKKDSFDTWENTKPDCDFWGTENNVETENESRVASKCLETKQILETKSSKEDENKIYDRDSPPRKKIKVNDRKSSEGENGVCDTTENSADIEEVSQKCHKTAGAVSDTGKDNENDKCIKQGKNENDKNLISSNCIAENSDDKKDIGNNVISSEEESDNELENKTGDLPQETDNKLENKAVDSPQEMIVDDYDRENVEMLDPHPCCVEEDTDGQYLVVDDSDCDDTITNVQIKRKNIWRPVKKADTYPYKEPLILSLEEAFFLSYGLGCLTVRDQTNSAMSLSDMWCQLCDMKQRFLPSYVAYHYFRSKGWVPRSGIIFGVDFIVYRVGPPFYHGSYSVIVKTVYEGDYQEVERYTNRKLTWTSFAGLNRITEHVAKSLMFCYVIMPKSLTDKELRSPSCLSQFKVRLQVVNRWVSSQEREKDAEPEMP